MEKIIIPQAGSRDQSQYLALCQRPRKCIVVRSLSVQGSRISIAPNPDNLLIDTYHQANKGDFAANQYSMFFSSWKLVPPYLLRIYELGNYLDVCLQINCLCKVFVLCLVCVIVDPQADEFTLPIYISTLSSDASHGDSPKTTS